MKRYTILYGLLAVLFICIGCQEQDMMQYENDPAIYFANQSANATNNITQHDSINHSFFIYGTDVTRDTVHILICTMGMPTEYDRSINLVQTNIG